MGVVEIAESPAALVLRDACDDLSAGLLPDRHGRKLLARAGRAFLNTPSCERDAVLRQDGLAERNHHFRELAAVHFANKRGAAVKIHELAARYFATAWQTDQHKTTCPKHLIGTPEDYVWRALRAYPVLPKPRQLRNIFR